MDVAERLFSARMVTDHVAPDGDRPGGRVTPPARATKVLFHLLATIAAWILLSLAAGMGVPRLDEGMGAIALAVLAAIAGIGSLVAAGVLLFRAFRRWALLLVVPWCLALLVCVYSLSIALAAVHPPHPSASAPPAGAESVTMTAADGVRLSGWYLPSRNGAAVVLRHGSGSTTASTVAQAQVLHDAGYGVLATDARGHGDSDGQGMDFGWFGEDDIRAAVDLLVTQPDIDADRIAVVGLSMGGEEAIGAAGVDDRIRAVVAEGATGRTAADKAWQSEEYGFAGTLQGALDAITYGFIDSMTPAAPPPTLADSVRASSSTRFLLIAAGAVADEQSVSSRLGAIDPDRVQVWVVADAQHVGGLDTAPTEWADRVIGFLDDALATTGAR